MDGFVHIFLMAIASAGGLALLISFLASIVKVALLNRHRQDLTALFAGRIAYRILYHRPWTEKY